MSLFVSQEVLVIIQNIVETHYDSIERRREKQKSTFSWIGLQTSIIPANAKIACKSCFSWCGLPTLLTLETTWHLQ
jgi:Pyruvate/2-oxoacid:ferredoxin oxidoreductase delta subunit